VVGVISECTLYLDSVQQNRVNQLWALRHSFKHKELTHLIQLAQLGFVVEIQKHVALPSDIAKMIVSYMRF
jgi:hypothetical protein